MSTFTLTPTSLVESKSSSKPPITNNVAKRLQTTEARGYLVNKASTSKRLWLMFLMKEIKNLYFLTITFPLGLCDDAIFVIMNSVFTNLKKQGYLKTYLWVSERQKNGTLHFHCFITDYLPADKFKSAMCSALLTARKNGLTDYSTEKLERYQGFFFSKTRKGKVANLKKLKGNKRKTIINYVTKYVTKTSDCSESQPIHHRRVAMSRNISSLPLKIQVPDEYLFQCHVYAIVPATEKNLVHREDYVTVYMLTRIPPKQFEFFWQYIASCNMLHKEYGSLTF